jgi:hypothetical protein
LVDPIVLGLLFLLQGGESSEQETAGEGHDGGTAGRDLVAGLEFVEFAERMVDVFGRAEFLDVTDERGGDVGLVEILWEQSGVFGAEAGVWVGNGHAAKSGDWRMSGTGSEEGWSW